MKKQTPFEHTVPAVEKTVAVLGLMAASQQGLTHAFIARSCGITPSTCYRILQSLLKYDWIEKHPDGTFTLGTGLLPLALCAASSATGHWDRAHEILTDLSEKTALAAKLSIRENTEQVVLARADVPGPVRISGKTGARFPIAEGSVGAALLADADEEECSVLLASCTADIPEKKEPDLLWKSVSFVKRNDYLLNTEKNRWRIGALSVPVRDPAGRVAAALTLLGPADDFTKKRLPALLSALKQARIRFFE